MTNDSHRFFSDGEEEFQVDCKVYRGSLIQQLLDVVALFFVQWTDYGAPSGLHLYLLQLFT